MYIAEREFYIKQTGPEDPKDPLSKYSLGTRLADLQKEGIFHKSINRLLFLSLKERSEAGFLEFFSAEIHQSSVVEVRPLDWTALALVSFPLLLFYTRD